MNRKVLEGGHWACLIGVLVLNLINAGINSKLTDMKLEDLVNGTNN